MNAGILRVRLFGELDLRCDGEILPPLESARVRSLLAYLMLNRETPQPRQRVAFLFWPDSSEAQARTNLRHLLHTLQRAVPALAPFLELGRGTLRLRMSPSISLDVADFAALLARGAGEGGDEIAALLEAVELYRGDLLAGCYDEWITMDRDRLRRRYLDALERLTRLLEARGDHTSAIRYAEEFLGREPLDEATYRRLMRLHFGRGDLGRALSTYERCVGVLERELGVEPSAATREMYEALRRPELAVLGDGGGDRIAAPPLVGRAREWERLTDLWRATAKGRAQLVLVTGEPGIGKTRLIEELRAWCAHRGAVTAESRSYRAEGALAYGPVAAWLRSEGLRPQLARLDSANLSEVARLLPELLSEVPHLRRPEPLPESDQRMRMFAAVSRAILGAGTPLLLIADDLHWADRETLRLIHHLLRVGSDAPILVAATARREEMDDRHPLDELVVGLRMLDRVVELELERLGPEETTALGEQLAGRPLGRADADRLYAQTEGNPLFVVEAVRAGWSGGSGDGHRISAKVQAVIQQRLAQLTEPARDLAGLAATVGREFTADMVARASGLDEETLVRGLSELWRSRIIREHRDLAYDFSHDKLREVAYLGLSPARRRQNHLAVARALERLHADDPGPVSAQIAGHYVRAGVVEEAITWYEEAAEAAQALHASSDAVRLLGRALELLEPLPVTPVRQARELAIVTAMLTPVASFEGFASSRLDDLHSRGLEFARRLRVAPPPELLRSLAITSLSRDDFESARRFGEQLREHGRGDGDDALLAESEYVLGIAAFWQGELAAARHHFEAAVSSFRPDRRRRHLLRYWLDPQVVCLSRLGNTLWFLGDAAGSSRARNEALALAAEVGHPHSHATALIFAACLAVETEDTEGLRSFVAALDSLPAENSARPTQTAIGVLKAYIRVLDGDGGGGIATIRESLNDPGGAEHAPGLRAIIARLLLAACTAAGEVQGRLAAAERLLRMGGAARLWAAEAHLARAECLAQLGAQAGDIAAELENALDIARRQGARMLERRAEASPLRHVLPNQGSSESAVGAGPEGGIGTPAGTVVERSAPTFLPAPTPSAGRETPA